MNLSEGTRRLAVLLGVVGAMLGGFASYMELQTVIRQRADHNEFEKLASSPAVQRERACKLGDLSGGCTEDSSGPYPDSKRVRLPGGEIRDYPEAIPEEEISKLLGKEFYLIKHESAITPPKDADSGPWDEAAKAYRLEHSDIRKAGIRTINWTKRFEVDSIETGDGQTLYSTPVPAWWMYLLIAISPVLGFIVPWAAIRAIGWVGAGFFQAAR